jgi:hypothetical protein
VLDIGSPSVLRVSVRPGLANQVHRVAIVAFGQGVMLGELDPVSPLVGRQDAAALAQRTDAIERREDGGPDELRPIWDTVHRLQQRGVRLEGNDFLFSLRAHENWPQFNTLYYRCRICLSPCGWYVLANDNVVVLIDTVRPQILGIMTCIRATLCYRPAFLVISRKIKGLDAVLLECIVVADSQPRVSWVRYTLRKVDVFSLENDGETTAICPKGKADVGFQ